jgi:hypothetical protein
MLIVMIELERKGLCAILGVKDKDFMVLLAVVLALCTVCTVD